jgi:Flp pilus assembly protein TadB
MAKSGLGRSDRFYENPILRDQEWDRAKQAPWWLMAVSIGIVAIAFFVGVYTGSPYSTIGWIAGIVTILIYLVLGWRRRRQARQKLREAHGQNKA